MKKRIWLAVAALATALAGGAAPAQETGVYRCGTGNLPASMEREGARKAAEEAAVEAVAEKERVAAPAREKKGLVLHYDFGRGGTWGPGAVVEDSSGRGRDGRVEGDGLEAVNGMGRGKKAARFDGKGDFIRVPRDEAFEGREITVAAWVKVREGVDWVNGATIAFKRNASFNHNEGYCLEIFPDRTVRTTVSGPNAAQCRIQSSVPMEDGAWHLLAMTHAPGDTRLYVDGALAGEGKFPAAVEHNPAADLLIGGRDHAQYPTDRFGVFDLAEVLVGDTALGADEIGVLHREKTGLAKAGNSGTDQTAVVEFGPERRLTWKGIEPLPKVFPEWKPVEKPAGNEAGLAGELRVMVAQGWHDRAASPEFLDALETLLEKHADETEIPSDQLPFTPMFRGPGMPAGWRAVNPAVWRFGDGEARQVESKANTRYVLFYEPGVEWTDYEATFRFESDAWFLPPANSCAVLYFRYRAIDDSYSLCLDGKGRLTVASLDKGCGSRQRVLARVPLDVAVVKDGKPWTVKVHGENIEVRHEGQRVLWTTDKAHRCGTVGLESVHIPMRFGGVEVRGTIVPGAKPGKKT